MSAATQLNPFSVVHHDLPPEWDPIDPEIQAWLLTHRNEHGLVTQQQVDVEEQIIARRWYLITNSLGLRCKSCRQGIMPGAVHPYVTYSCEPRPFNGLNEVWAYWKYNVGDNIDVMMMRLTDNAIVPITSAQAQKLYLRIEMRTKKNLAWKDFWVRYRKRYNRYLPTVGWRADMLTPEQWKRVQDQARKEFIAGGGQ